MAIVYLTLDEVNAAMAARLARRLGVRLLARPLAGRGQSAGRVYDLDFQPAEVKAKLVADAAAGRVPAGTAVHSYNLTPVEERVLRAARVRVGRRLTARLLATVVPRRNSLATG